MLLAGQIDRILVVRLGSIGDIIRATAVVKALRQEYPKATIDFLTTRSGLPVLANNRHLSRIYILDELRELTNYDWVINLQQPNVLPSFLENTKFTFNEILDYLSRNVSHKLLTGRQILNGNDVCPVSVFHCRSEMEEQFFNALLPYSHARVVDTEIELPNNRSAVLERLSLRSADPYLGIFIGTNTSGGDDDGQRTYSMDFIESLIHLFSRTAKIVIIGQSNSKSAAEMARYRKIINDNPHIVDLVDKTTLDELISVISSFRLLITCDSSPLHIAMSLRVPVIGLYVNAARFKISEYLRGERYVLMNAFEVCSNHSVRWKFHCMACRPLHARMYGCNLKSVQQKVDKISLEKIRAAADVLLSNPALARVQ
jgi:ADP-heptose:LPS heptosyltransferase